MTETRTDPLTIEQLDNLELAARASYGMDERGQVLINGVLALIAEVKQLRDELDVTGLLLDTRNKVLDAIPECPDHGSQCVPHALEWIENVQKQIAQLAEALEVAIG